MPTATPIDITFDFRSDTPPGKDPDALSPTLRRYHKLLWSKPLPNGAMFDLDDSHKNCYLYHNSGLGEFWISSDSVVPTFQWSSLVKEWIGEEALADFIHIGYTIGGMMVFPGNQVDGKWTINQARGCLRKIRDRFDLTVECIRRHYHGEQSPMSDTLKRYDDFFGLFGDFRGYAEFFLLQDLVSEDFQSVNLFTPFENFQTPAFPESREAYLHYREQAINFLHARNKRIKVWATAMLHDPHRTC